MNTRVASARPDSSGVAPWRVWRRRIGLAIVCGGAAVLAHDLYQHLAASDPRVRGALLGGLMAALRDRARHLAGAGVAAVLAKGLGHHARLRRRRDAGGLLRSR